MLQACVSPASDMLNNRFVEISPTLQSIDGIWTGTMGPYLMTFKIKGDGTGYSCYSYGTAEVLEKLKVSQDMMYLSDGTRLKVEEINKNSLVVKNIYLGLNKSFKFIGDEKLDNASPYCAKALKQ